MDEHLNEPDVLSRSWRSSLSQNTSGLPDVGDGSPRSQRASDVKRAVSSEGAVTRAGARHL